MVVGETAGGTPTSFPATSSNRRAREPRRRIRQNVQGESGGARARRERRRTRRRARPCNARTASVHRSRRSSSHSWKAAWRVWFARGACVPERRFDRCWRASPPAPRTPRRERSGARAGAAGAEGRDDGTHGMGSEPNATRPWNPRGTVARAGSAKSASTARPGRTRGDREREVSGPERKRRRRQLGPRTRRSSRDERHRGGGRARHGRGVPRRIQIRRRSRADSSRAA